MINLRNIVVYCSNIFGDPYLVVIDNEDNIRLVYSTLVFFELKKLKNGFIEFTIIISSGKNYSKRIKTTSEDVITKAILETILAEK